jgi:polyphosphate kinase
MPRNLDRRIEAVTPIEDPASRLQVRQLLEFMLEDNRQAWVLMPDGAYVQRRPPSSSQERGTHKRLIESHREVFRPITGEHPIPTR